MNTDTLAGNGTQLGGKLKETLGEATGDETLRTDGLVDQIGGTVQKSYGHAKDVVEDGIRPLIDYVRQFAKERPFTAAAVAGALGIAIVNSPRGK